ncbi:MAG: hypothetical protein AAF225_03690 [Pseudomonadota bacterium]
MTAKSEPFFFSMAVLLIVIVISGFSVVSFQRPGGPLATPFFLHFHGAVFLSWFLLLAFQARLIGARSYKFHGQLGLMSLGLAVAIVIIGYLVVRMTVQKPDGIIAGRPALIGAIFPTLDIINFAIAYSLGVLNRGNANAHKRLMLIAAIMMIDAAMARLIFGLGLPGTLIIKAEFSLLLAILVYDLVKLRRPHWATLIGMLLYIAAMRFKLSIDGVSWWPAFSQAFFS